MTNLDWKKFSPPVLPPKLESTPSTGLLDASQSETKITLDSSLGANNSSDLISLGSLDLSPVESSQDTAHPEYQVAE